MGVVGSCHRPLALAGVTKRRFVMIKRVMQHLMFSSNNRFNDLRDPIPPTVLQSRCVFGDLRLQRSGRVLLKELSCICRSGTLLMEAVRFWTVQS